MKKAKLVTYSLEDGKHLKEKPVKVRICWGEPTRDIEVVVGKMNDIETALFIPLDQIIVLIRDHINGRPK